MLKYIKSIFHIGVTEGIETSERRTIVLANALTINLFLVNVLLFVLIPTNHNIEAFTETVISFVIFSIPLLLNHFKLFNLNRFYLSWVPPILIFAYLIDQIKEASIVTITIYDGIKIYLVASACLPFLLFGPKDKLKLVLAMLPSFILLIFMDPLMDMVGVGIEQLGVDAGRYHLNKTRSVIAYFVISASSFALKYLIEKSDQDNRKLMDELALKNEEIKLHAGKALMEANLSLKKKIDELNEREFFLNQSQKIAKVGSWEYSLQNSNVIWSDELYNILGIDKSVDVRDIDMNELLYGEDSEIFQSSTVNLLKTGESYDVTVKAKTPLGYMKWLRLFSFPISKDGEIIGTRGICHDVTYYKEAEELLRKREYKYRSMFEQASDSIIIADLEGNLIDVNSRVTSLLGYSRKELLQMNISDLIEPKQLAEKPLKLSELKKGARLLVERNLVCKDGSVINTEVSSNKFGDESLLGIIRDLTESKKTQKLIEESQARFRVAFEYSAIGMAMLSPLGQYIKVNEQLCNILGYEEEELLTLTFYDLTHEEDLEENTMLFNEALNGIRSTYTFEKRYIHKSGSLIWVNTAVSLVRDGEGESLYFIVHIENITDRKKAEMELVEAETKFRTLIEKSLVGVYIVQENTYKYVNEAFCKMVGYGSDEILEKMPIHELIHPEDRELVAGNIKKRLEKKIDSIRYEFRGVRKNGEEYWVEAFGSRIPFEGENAIIGTIIDITERKRFEEQHALIASIVSSSDDAIISCAKDGLINSWNKGAEKIFGYTYDETQGKDLNVIIFKESLSGEIDIHEYIENGKALENFRIKGVRKDGKVIELSLTVSPIINDTGEIIGASIIGRDITFRVIAEKAIMESEERYRTLVENAPEALVVFDMDHQVFINVSQSAEELFKISAENLLKSGPSQISPEFQPNGERSETLALKWLSQAYEKGSAVFDWMHQDAKGNKIPCEVRLIRLPSEDKKLIRGSIIDISDRIKKEKEVAELNKKVGELKLMALRSVMSPHFVFNALNSIQFYIAKNDRLNAINYLSTFSKLVRGVLNHSVDNKIKLSDEIELLKNYIDLEQIRFENKFQYQFEIDTESDPDSIEIPSLLIQPYVENAILHGLYNKEEKGHLFIKFFEDDDKLTIQVEDDGIGVKKASELKNKGIGKKHKSMGTKLTKERLNLISKEKNVSLKVDDLSKNGHSGTRVTIEVPI